MITIVDYGVGNIASLVNMFDYVDAAIDVSCAPDRIAGAKALVLPGVGSFAHAMSVLESRGLDIAIKSAAREGAQILGVCLGAQLLARRSEEGGVAGLGLVAADVKRIVPSSGFVKVPNMGWREVRAAKESWMVADQGEQPDRFYFAHSYHIICDNLQDVVATIDYDGLKTVAFSNNKIHGVQFHPEKSHSFGMRTLAQFARLSA